MPNFNSIGSGVSEPQVAENRYLPLTGGIALTTVYALTCYTVNKTNGQNGAWPRSRDLLSKFMDPPNISGTAEDTNLKFCMPIAGKGY